MEEEADFLFLIDLWRLLGFSLSILKSSEYFAEFASKCTDLDIFLNDEQKLWLPQEYMGQDRGHWVPSEGDPQHVRPPSGHQGG